MKFRFFFLRRKGESGTQRKKLGGICCFHAQEPSRPAVLFGPSDVTAIVHDTPAEEQCRPTEHHNSSGGEASRTSSYSDGNDVIRRGSVAITAQSNTGTEESFPTSRVLDATPMRSIPRGRSPGKGPGLGATGDEPPSRMQQESHELDLGSLLHPRRHSNGTQAPQLPTRLEVCVDRNRPQGFQTLMTDSAASDRSIGSHPLSDSSPSPLADSVAPRRRRPSQDAPRRSESSRETSTRSSSPNTFIDTSIRHEEITNQPTRQATQEVWRFDSNANEVPSMNGAQRLCEWHVRLKLDWISSSSNDLVAEVCLDSRSSPASVNSSSSERAQQMTCEIAEDEDIDLVRRSPSQDILISNHSSVVDIVDRVLAELQREKRTRRHHTGIESTSKTHDDRRPTRPSNEEDHTFETEFYRDRCSSTVRMRRRIEVLQAFEVLIDKKQHLLSAFGDPALPWLPDVSLSTDESEEFEESDPKRMLEDGIFHDLKLEIARLASELQNRCSCSDDGMGTQLLSQTLKSSISHFQTETHEDDASSQETSSRGKRAQSAPVTSSYQTHGIPDMLSMQRAASCYSELQPVSLSRLNNGLIQRAEVKERCTRMASLDEESLFAKMSDLASSTAS